MTEKSSSTPDPFEMFVAATSAGIADTGAPGRQERGVLRWVSERLAANGFEFHSDAHRRAAAAVFLTVTEAQQRFEREGTPIHVLEGTLGYVEVLVALGSPDPFPEAAGA